MSRRSRVGVTRLCGQKFIIINSRTQDIIVNGKFPIAFVQIIFMTSVCLLGIIWKKVVLSVVDSSWSNSRCFFKVVKDTSTNGIRLIGYCSLLHTQYEADAVRSNPEHKH